MAFSSSISKYTTIQDIENSFIPPSLAKKIVPSLNLKALEDDKATVCYMGTSRKKKKDIKISNLDLNERSNNLINRSKKFSLIASDENRGFLSLRTPYNSDKKVFRNVSHLIKEKEGEQIKEKSKIFMKEPAKQLSSEKNRTRFYSKMYYFDHNDYQMQKDISQLKSGHHQKLLSSDFYEMMKSNRDSLLKKEKEILSPTSSSSLNFHKTQNKNFAKPSPRKDVEELDKWLTCMLSQINSKDDLPFLQAIEHLEIIYTACLKEIIRQVSLQCSERGQLLEKVWNSYLQLLEKALFSSNKEKEKIEIGYLSKIKKIFQMMDREKNLFEEKISSLISEKRILEEKNVVMYKDSSYARNKIGKLEKENGILRFQNDELIKECRKLNFGLFNYERKMNGERKSSINFGKTNESMNGEEKKKLIAMINEIGILSLDVEECLMRKEIGINTDPINYEEMNGMEIDEITKVGRSSTMTGINRSQSKLPSKKTKDSMISLKSLTQESTVNTCNNNQLQKATQTEGEEKMRDQLLDDINENSKNHEYEQEIQHERMHKQSLKIENALKFLHNQRGSIVLESSNASKIVKVLNEANERLFDVQNLRSQLNALRNELTLILRENKKNNVKLQKVKSENKELKDSNKVYQENYAETMIKYEELLRELEKKKESPEPRRNRLSISQINKTKKLMKKAADIFKKKIFSKPEKNPLLNDEINEIGESLNSDENIPMNNGDEKSQDSSFYAKKLSDVFNDLPQDDLFEIEDDEEDEQIENAGSKKSLRRMVSTFSKKSIGPKSDSYWNVPKLGYKKKNTRVFSVHTEKANELLNKMLQDKNSNIKTKISKQLFAKFISSVYTECLAKQKEAKYDFRNPLHVFLYEFFLNKYGLKKAAEKKLKQIFLAALYYKNISPKFLMFCRFLGLEDSLSAEEFAMFLEWMKISDENNNGGLTIACSTQDKIIISLSRAEESFEKVFKNTLTSGEYKINLAKIYELKFELPILKKNVIEFEKLFLLVMDIYRRKKENMKIHLENLFFAADLDNNEALEFAEFKMLYRAIEKKKEKLDEIALQKLFSDESDLIIASSDERVLSLNKFIELSMKNNLFKKEKIDQFIANVDLGDIIKNFKDLEQFWEEKYEIILNRLYASNSYDSNFQTFLNNLSERIADKKVKTHIIWIAYRILDEETKYIVSNYYALSFLPLELVSITKLYQGLLEDKNLL